MMQMITNKIALDTNVLVYIIVAKDSFKHERSKSILIDFPIISTQVVSEFLNVAKRLLNKPKAEVLQKCIE